MAQPIPFVISPALRLSANGANLIGAAFTTFYFLVLDPVSLVGLSPEAKGNLLVFILANTAMVFALAIFFEHRNFKKNTPTGPVEQLEFLFYLPRLTLHFGMAAWTWMGLAMAFYGVLVLDQPWVIGFHQFVGITLAGGALGNFGAYLLTDLLAKREAARLLPDLEVSEAPKGARLGRMFLIVFGLLSLIPLLMVGWYGAFFKANQERGVEDPQFYIISAALFFLTLSVLVAGVGLAWTGSRLLKPLREITKFLGFIALGRFDYRLDVLTDDEIGYLAGQINKMAKGLSERERIRDLFGRYVNEQVLDEISSGRLQLETGGREAKLTILFTDLRGFSALAEQQGAQEIMALLNRYFEVMTNVIMDHGGSVLEFLGDGILAIFGAPVPLENCSERAAMACLEMSHRLRSLNEEWAKAGQPTLEMGMGLHYGEANVGNLGSTRCMRYSVVGDTVNLASRIEQFNKVLGSHILVSSDVAHRLGLGFRLTPKGHHPVKGREQAVELFELSA